jgi:diaminopropionate ammonia-lyase
VCCGTLSANAWPVLKAGVDLAITVEDEDVHEAIQQLHKYGVHAGPCGAACLAGLLRLVGSGVCALDKDAVIVLLCTEGERGYRMVA